MDLNKKNVSPPTGLSKSTTLSTPGFTRGHNSNAPSEPHFIYNHNLSVKSVEFVVGRLKLFRIKEILVEKEPRRGAIIMTPGPAAADGGCGGMLFIRAPKAAKLNRRSMMILFSCFLLCSSGAHRSLDL